MKYTTEIRKDLDGNYQVGFTIGNQTFYLAAYGIDDSEESKNSAQWQEELLKIALNNLENGNHFTKTIEVGNPFEVTEYEFRKITANQSEQFHLINK